MLLEYCTECGNKITDEAMADGAVRVGRNTYLCVKCVKAGVLKNAGTAPPVASPARPIRSPSRPPSTPLTHLPSSRPPRKPAASKAPMIVAAGGVLLLGVGVLFVALKPTDSGDGAPKADSPAEKKDSASSTDKKTDTEDPAKSSGDKKGEPETPAKGEYDPRASVANSKLLQAKAWFKENPESLDDYRERLDEVRTGYARTPAADEAAKLIAEIKVLPSALAEAAPAESAWAAGINLLPPTDLKVDTVRGEWTRKGDVLVSDQKLGGKTAMIALPYVPPEEYDIRVAGMRTWGNDGIGLRIPRGEHDIEFVLAGWRDSMQGFERIKGERVVEAGANFKQSELIKNNQPFTLVLQVRRKIIKAYIDSRLICELRAPAKDVSVCDRDWSSPYNDRINIGTWESTYEIQHCDVIELTGKGRLIPAASRPELQRGLWASYFTSEKDPERFKNFVFARAERSLQWNVGEGRIDHDIHQDQFDIRYGGFLRVTQPGKHRFHLNVDDVVTFWIDGKEIGKTGPAMSDNFYEVDLAPGDHPFRIDFTEINGIASMQIEWQIPGQNRTYAIPTEALWYDPAKIESYQNPPK